jgi:hypothetical protein
MQDQRNFDRDRDIALMRRAFEAVFSPTDFALTPVDPCQPVPFSIGCARMGFARSTGYAMLKAQATAEEQGHEIQGPRVPKPHKRGDRNFFFEHEIAEYNRAVAAANNKLPRSRNKEDIHLHGMEVAS